MTVLYVTSDQPGAGKTALCVTLAHRLARQGKKAAVFKPIAGPGAGNGTDPDAASYQALLGQPSQDWPFVPSGPSLAPDLLKRIKGALTKTAQGKDLVLAEGTATLSPQESSQLASALEAQVLAVVRYQPDLDVARLSAWLSAFGDRLMGIVVNGVTRYQGTTARARLLPALQAAGIRCLGTIPEDRRLAAVRVHQLAEHLGGRFIVCQDGPDRLVEYLMVGVNSLDNTELFFGLRENKAVIVRGDRPDIQMGALATSTACMVLTRGVEPVEYIRYEAEQAEVPLVVVESDTQAIMASLDTLVEKARFDHPAKVERFSQLLDQHVDVGYLLTSLGLG